MKDSVHEPNGGGLEGVLVWKINSYFPDAIFVVRIFGALKLDHKLVNSSQYLYFIIVFNPEVLHHREPCTSKYRFQNVQKSVLNNRNASNTEAFN